ncbi:MAG: RadC family protein [Christensenellaceae bacterium]
MIDIHTGHRERLRKQFLKSPPEALNDHQLLELLLFYAIPQKDTNPLAHRLLDKFGSLQNLLNASPADIMLVDGVGEYTAVLFGVLSELSRRHWFSGKDQHTQITSIDSAAEYARAYLAGKPYEQFYVFCLDTQYRVKNAECLSTGTTREAAVYIRQVVQSVLRAGTEKILVAHNHPGGKPSPSKSDIQTTLDIKNAMDAIQIEFMDHIIIGENEYFSFAAEMQLDRGITLSEARAAQYSGGVMQDIKAYFKL